MDLILNHDIPLKPQNRDKKRVVRTNNVAQMAHDDLVMFILPTHDLCKNFVGNNKHTQVKTERSSDSIMCIIGSVGMSLYYCLSP